MGWAILSGAASATDYDGYLAVVRHNGSAGESVSYAPLSATAGGARIYFADPYIYVVSFTGSNQAYFDVKKLTLNDWPASVEDVSFNATGVVFEMPGVFKEGSFYYGMGGQLDPGGRGISYATTSVDGLLFYSRVSFPQATRLSETHLVRGENGRFVCLIGRIYFGGHLIYHTDNFIDFLPKFENEGTYNTIVDAAGNSSGKWVLIKRDNLELLSSYVSTDNLETFSLLDGLAFTKVWAFGATLYGAVNGTLYSSTDAVTWTSKGTPFGNASLDVYDITYDGSSTYLIVGELGNAVTTTAFSTYIALPGYDFAGHALFGAVYVDDAILYPVVVPPYSATIQGTLRLDTSTGAFAARKVYLYNYTTGDKVAQTTSDGTTGEWSFTQVAPGDYFVVGAAQGDDLNVPRDFDALGVITVV